MKKSEIIDQIVGVIYILLSFYFINRVDADPTPVDEFNIYWMFTHSAMSLGGFLIVADSNNKYLYWGTRGILILTILYPIYLVFSRDLGAAFYFPWIFLFFGSITIAKSIVESRSGNIDEVIDEVKPSKKLFAIDHKRAVILISRIFVGSLFIVSGLIKANDPLGFSYKLEEYFTKTALGENWVMFYDWSLFLAVLIAAVEVLLGLAVLFGGKTRLAAVTLLSMALFFAWLTWFTADCMDQQKAFGEEHMKVSMELDKKYTPQYDQLKKEYEYYYDYINEPIDDTYTEEDVKMINECKAKIAALDKKKAEEEKSHGEWTRTCVDDCGCFGDAMKGSVGRSLTPWESFYKDICLLFFVIVLLLHSGKIKLNPVNDDLTILPVSLLIIALFSGGLFDWMFPFYFTFAAIVLYWLLKKYHIKKIGAEWTIAIVMFLFSLGFTLYCLWYLPIKDFRPYAIGNNLIEQRTSIQPELKFYYTLKDKATGEEKEFDHWPEGWDTKYDYVSSRNIVIKEGVDAPAKDFSISYKDSQGKDVEITDSVLALDEVFLLVAYDLKHADADALQRADEFTQAAKKDGKLVICLTASGSKVQDSVSKKLDLDLRFYAADEKVQKTIIRSNPGLVLVKKAVVTEMWPAALWPVYEDVKNEYLK